jgi:uncharacterized Ntn-hydrolase superfamily protein
VVLLSIRVVCLAGQIPISAPAHLQKLAHTYGIVAYDSATGDLGGNTAYGERGLDLIAQGATAEEALRIVMRTDTMLQHRQVGIVDARVAETFERSTGGLADRLMAALKAGQAGGGDKRGLQSAAPLVVRKNGGYLGANDRFIDIRVYDAKDPIAELERLLALHKLHLLQGSATPEFLEALKNLRYWENCDVRVRMDGKIDRVVLDDIFKKRNG